jgi:hypothetical protein
MRIAEAFAVSGLVVQWAGVYFLAGWPAALVVAGTELAALGVAGVIRHAH